MNPENEEKAQDAMPAQEFIEKLASEQDKSFEIQLLEAKNLAEDFKGKYLRALADAENLRKRLQKEKQELIQYAVQNVILEFLPPIDNFENALRFTEQASDEVKHWAIGFEMILSQFKDALANNNVTHMEALGAPFDHDSHEAIEMVDTQQHAPGTVVEVSMKGYKIGDKILRPARVKVAKDSATASNTANTRDVNLDEEINEFNPQ